MVSCGEGDVCTALESLSPSVQTIVQRAAIAYLWNITGRQFGFFGEPRVNVLLLNIALDSAMPRSTTPLRP